MCEQRGAFTHPLSCETCGSGCTQTAMMDTISNGALNMLRELTLPGGRVPEDLKKRIKKAVVDKGKGGAVKFSHF